MIVNGTQAGVYPTREKAMRMVESSKEGHRSGSDWRVRQFMVDHGFYAAAATPNTHYSRDAYDVWVNYKAGSVGNV